MPRRNKKFVDAYGEELWSYFKSGKPYEVIERDDGLIDVGLGGRNYFAVYKDWPRIEKLAMKYVRGRVLDIGCGAGRHSLYLQKKKFDVTGVDNSPLAIKICKLRGLKKARLLPLEDIGKFKDSSFDSVIMMGNNFGLLGNLSKARKLLKQFYKITSPGALIIGETGNPYKTNIPDNLEYHKRNLKEGRMGGQLKIRVVYRKLRSSWFDYLMVSKKELIEILKGTGWKIKRIIASKGAQYVAVIGKQ